MAEQRVFEVLANNQENQTEILEIVGAIKWYDSVKGYGFVTPDKEGIGDALLHRTCLVAGGYLRAPDGARVRCKALRNGTKGYQIFKVLEMDESTATEPSQIMSHLHVDVRAASGWERAIVKWFNNVRGYGFLTCGEGMPDIFVHITTVKHYGFVELRPGQGLWVRWGNGSKGRTAAELKPL